MVWLGLLGGLELVLYLRLCSNYGEGEIPTSNIMEGDRCVSVPTNICAIQHYLYFRLII